MKKLHLSILITMTAFLLIFHVASMNATVRSTMNIDTIFNDYNGGFILWTLLGISISWIGVSFLIRWLVLRDSVTIEYYWDNLRQTRLTFKILKNGKEVIDEKFQVSDYYGNETYITPKEIELAVIEKIKENREIFSDKKRINFYGLRRSDREYFMDLLKKAGVLVLPRER